MENTISALKRLRGFNQLVGDADNELASETADIRTHQLALESVNTSNQGVDPAAASFNEESIILRRYRPSLRIENDAAVLDFADAIDSSIWRTRLQNSSAQLTAACRATGRVNLHNASVSWVGTAWLVTESVIVTNRHVAEQFCVADASAFTFITGDEGPVAASIDFLAEFDNPHSREFRITRVLHVVSRPGPDIAFLEVAQTSGSERLAAPIALAQQVVTTEHVATIGYPAYDSRIPDIALMEKIYGSNFDKKRLAPGSITRVDDVKLLHNCTTLGGNSGSAIVDLNSGRALGLHFSGAFLKTNYAVRADVVARVLADVLDGHRPVHVVGGTHKRVNSAVSVPLTVTVTLADQSVLTATTTVAISASHAVGVNDDDDGIDQFDEARPEDYRDRTGYDARFLGDSAAMNCPLPQVIESTDAVLEFMFEGEPTTELRYEHFSVVMNRPRRLCFFSAVNIDGSRYRSSRRAGWRRDPRIPEDAQIIKECYGRAPKFSRGHMTRRNDPSWGDLATSKLGNRDSMHVTNAVPQMQTFNAPVWLELEDYALDNAVEDDMKLSVFTGPYFSACDPVLFGVQVPVKFWKVIAFVHDETGELTATGYQMDQTESLRPDEEFVFGDFTSRRQGVAAQVSIASIEANAGISFGPLANRDPLSIEEAVAANTFRALTSAAEVRYY